MMKKRSFLGRVAVIAMALTLATTSMMSGTLARYGKELSVTPYALIASWQPEIKANNAVVQSGTTIDLADSKTSGVTVSTNNQVIGTTTSEMIAPGTSGKYSMLIDCSKADVNTVATVTAKPKTGYTFPGHLKVTIKDEGGKTLGTMQGTYATNHWTSPFGEAEDTDYEIIGGSSDSDPLLFKTVKDGGEKQTMGLSLEWEWPLDRGNNAATSKESTDTAYDAEDATYGTLVSSTNQKFGFDLVITLQQSGAISSDEDYQVVK